MRQLGRAEACRVHKLILLLMQLESRYVRHSHAFSYRPLPGSTTRHVQSCRDGGWTRAGRERAANKGRRPRPCGNRATNGVTRLTTPTHFPGWVKLKLSQSERRRAFTNTLGHGEINTACRRRGSSAPWPDTDLDMSSARGQRDPVIRSEPADLTWRAGRRLTSAVCSAPSAHHPLAAPAPPLPRPRRRPPRSMQRWRHGRDVSVGGGTVWARRGVVYFARVGAHEDTPPGGIGLFGERRSVLAATTVSTIRAGSQAKLPESAGHWLHPQFMCL